LILWHINALYHNIYVLYNSNAILKHHLQTKLSLYIMTIQVIY